MSLKQTVRTEIPDTCTEGQTNLRRVTSLQLENADLLADSHSILNGWKNYLLNVHEVNSVRQTEIHKAEPLVPGPSSFEAEIAIEKFKT
jgi:hypothetical protein